MNGIIGVGAAVIVRDGNMVLMGKRLKEYGFGQYQLPGGTVEFMEQPSDAAIRELKEETGLDTFHVEFVGIKNVITEDQHYITFLFESPETYANDSRAPYVPDDEKDKVESWEWFPMDALPENTFEDIGKTLSEIFYMEKMDKLDKRMRAENTRSHSND